MALKNTNFSFKKIDDFYKNSKKIFFIGIGGISMSAIATYCLFDGKEIFGYDSSRGEGAKKLEKLCNIKYASTPDSVCRMDLVVYTNAIDENNFEYKKALALGIPTISRANFLGYIISRYKNKIGICGCHGKSTTVSYLAKIFEYASLSPCVFCGGIMKDYESALLYSKGDICIFEACEYMDSFLCLPTSDVGILNIDFDHPDYFHSLDDIKSSFKEFIKDSKHVFLNLDDENSLYLNGEKATTYGMDSEAEYKGEIRDGKFYVFCRGKELGFCRPKSMCKHFLYDALCAFSIAHKSGINEGIIFEALNDASGVKRRLEKIGNLDTGAPIFEDYAHHPREIESTISALNSLGYKKIFCIFESHTYSRTYYLYDDFKKAFKNLYKLYLLPIYSAREENSFKLDIEKIAIDFGGSVLYDKERVKELIKKSEADCVLLMGAGELGNIKKYL